MDASISTNQLSSGSEVPAGPISEPSVAKVEVKADPDSSSKLGTLFNTSPATSLPNPVRIKKEEPENGGIDKTLAEAENGDDMFGDVNDAEYVDLTYEGIAEVDGVNCFVCEEFKIRQIPKPVIVTRPLYQLFDCIESKHIILDPEYQREVVWDEGRAALLINSILMGYFIPPIIFNCVEKVIKIEGRKTSRHKRICVDGKQRLTSIWKFMTGQIGFFDSNSPQKKWFFCHPIVNGRETYSNHNILPNAVKEFFKNQAFCCYEYDELTLDTEETMFQLVQRGIALTPAEKMRAMSTEWATFTKQYEDDYSLIVNLSKQNRASGFRLVLTIFTMIQEVMTGRKKRSYAPTLQASPQCLLRVLDDRTAINPALKLKFKAIFDRYESLIKLSSNQVTSTRFNVKRNSVFDPAPDYLKEAGINHVKTFSPLELVATAILIAVHSENSTDEELLEDIKEMRLYLRLKHKDLRVNAQCWVTVWEFISNELDRKRSGKCLPANGASPTAGNASEGSVAQGNPATSTPANNPSQYQYSATTKSSDGADEVPDEKPLPVLVPPSTSSLPTREAVPAQHLNKTTSSKDRPGEKNALLSSAPGHDIGLTREAADAPSNDDGAAKTSSTKNKGTSRQISHSASNKQLKNCGLDVVSTHNARSGRSTPERTTASSSNGVEAHPSSQSLKRAGSVPQKSLPTSKKMKISS